MSFTGGFAGSTITTAGRKGIYVRPYLQKNPSWNRKDILITGVQPHSRLRDRLSSAKSVDFRYNSTLQQQQQQQHTPETDPPAPPASQLNRTYPLDKPSQATQPKTLVCDKCDGKHKTEECPIYPKPREDHPDALRRRPVNMGRPCGNVVVTVARVVRQPGDGSCLFHSLSHGMPNVGLRRVPTRSLRKEICAWIAANPTQPIAETPLSDWILWDTRLTPAAYSQRMSLYEWGGGIEMAVFSIMYNTPVQVWEVNKVGPGYRRISCFDPLSVKPDSDVPHTSCVNILYQGGVHYDALVI